MAVPFLPGILTGATLAVEVAWGANLLQAPATWTWSDITTDVQLDKRVRVKVGAANEAATTQPASLALTLSNQDGRYSQGGQSPNWPYVRQGTPVRVRIAAGAASAPAVVFVGYADEWTPDWADATGANPTVGLTASGVFRRLGQNSDPIASALRRLLSTDPAVVAYWPMEDGKQATSVAPGRPDGLPMSVYVTATGAAGPAKFASNTDFFGTEPLPQLNGATFDGPIPAYTQTGQWQIRMLAKFPNAGTIPNNATILRTYTASSDVAVWDLRYRTGGALALVAKGALDNVLYDTGDLGFDVDGKTLRISVSLTSTNPGYAWNLDTWDIPGEFGGGLDGTALPTVAFGQPTRTVLNPFGNVPLVAVGHLAVYSQNQDFLSDLGQLYAWRNDSYADRVIRVCRERSIPIDFLVPDGATRSAVDIMGGIESDGLVPLLRDAERTGFAILYDGTGSGGITMVTRPYRENRTPLLTVDAGARQLAGPFGVTDDDANRLNRAEAKRRGGASSVDEDSTGPRGTSAVGIYAGSSTFGNRFDEVMPDMAGWMVHMGTVAGYRIPQLVVDLAATPSLATGVLGLRPGERVDVINLRTVLGQFPAGTVELAVAGWQHDIGQHTWTCTLNCGPFEPWRVVRLAATTGDVDPFNGRADTTLSTLASSAPAGAPTLSVMSGVVERFETATPLLDIAMSWVRTNTTSHSGTWSLRSPAGIEDNGQRDCIVSVPAGATSVSFWYRVSSEDGFDFLNVIIGGVTVLSVSGDSGWVSAGPFDVRGKPTVTFRYSKDVSDSALEDAAFIDDLTFTVEPLWTTRADDFPITAEVGGIPVTVTGIAGTTSPQTFTVDPATVTKALPSGAPVAVYRPPALGL